MVLTTGLQAYYKLNEAAGNTRVDSVNANHLPESGGQVQSATGKLSNSANFPGGNTYTLRASSNVMHNYDTFSLSFWLNMGTLTTGGIPFTSHTWGFSYGWFIQYQNATDKVRYGGCYQPAWSWDLTTASTGLLTAGQWAHIVATRENGGYARLYVNNVEVASVSNSGTTDYAAVLAGNDNFLIGGIPYAGTGNFKVDEYGVWNRVLTVPEVQHLWNLGQGAFYDNNNPDDFDDEIPVCWNYTAKFKGSKKLFKTSGGGAFPRNLRVPGNVDKSTGKMIDDGQEIDPDHYEVF